MYARTTGRRKIFMIMITFGYKNKLSGILRAAAAVAIGLVMVLNNNASVTLVKWTGGLLGLAGVITLVAGVLDKKNGGLGLAVTNSIVDIVLGILLYANPEAVSEFIVYIIGFALLIFGVIQLIALIGAMSLVGFGFGGLTLTIFAIIGGILLIASPFAIEVMSVIAGVGLIIYGVQELISIHRMVQARKIWDSKNAGTEESQDEKPSSTTLNVKSSLEDVPEAEYHKVDDQS